MPENKPLPPLLVTISPVLAGGYGALMALWLADECYALCRLWKPLPFDALTSPLLGLASLSLLFGGVPLAFVRGAVIGQKRAITENPLLWMAFCAVGLFLCVMPILWLASGINAAFAPEPSPSGLDGWRFKVANLLTGLQSMRPAIEIGQQSDPYGSIAPAVVAPTVLLKLTCAALFAVVAVRARLADANRKPETPGR